MFKTLLLRNCIQHNFLHEKALYMYGIVDYLVQTLIGSVQADIYETSCHGIGMMTLYNQAAKEITASNCVKNVLDVLRNENATWSARQAALFALNQLLKCDVKNCQEFLDIQGQNHLLWLLRRSEKVPAEMLVGAVECIVTIARNQAFKHTVITTDIIDALCASFEVYLNEIPLLIEYILILNLGLIRWPVELHIDERLQNSQL
ncbi:uncharacterized protein LOC113465106 [Ceratina calcarata]|uniref:Uncharacterized protein LOC113465106 n=1 Tax=Ceratina calcarata TaxID=156304 RepID=A0AAJ7WFI8_9HYME|nr:uncharacterized protein LOC113465106 [Ceratina calcarata]